MRDPPPMPEPVPAAGPALPAIRVVLTDDSVLFREGLARVLAENGFLVVGQAGRTACPGSRSSLKPDLAHVQRFAVGASR
jgi:hypothetical protein